MKKPKPTPPRRARDVNEALRDLALDRENAGYVRLGAVRRLTPRAPRRDAGDLEALNRRAVELLRADFERPDAIPAGRRHRGVPLHRGQSDARLKVVKADVAAVLAMLDAEKLARAAEDVSRAPEARLLAAAKVEAMFVLTAECRWKRPDVDRDRVGATVAGLNSLNWRSPTHYASLMDHPRIGEHRPAAPRELPVLRSPRMTRAD